MPYKLLVPRLHCVDFAVQHATNQKDFGDVHQRALSLHLHESDVHARMYIREPHKSHIHDSPQGPPRV